MDEHGWRPNLYSDLGLHTIQGMRIVVDANLTEPCEDFSRSRSPSRARRRWKARGIRGQGVFERPASKAFKFKDKLVMHPTMLAQLNRELKQRIDNNFLRAIQGQA